MRLVLRILAFCALGLFLFTLSARSQQAEGFTFSFTHAKLDSALNVIEQNTDYRFVYLNALLADKQLNVAWKNETIYTVLADLRAQTGLEVSLHRRNTIVFSKREQRREPKIVTLEGIVRAADTKQAMAQVHIINEQSGILAASDESGRFSIQVPDAADSLNLIFSHVGFRSQRLAIQPNKNARIIAELESQTSDLPKVVVRSSRDLPFKHFGLRKHRFFAEFGRFAQNSNKGYLFFQSIHSLENNVVLFIDVPFLYAGTSQNGTQGEANSMNHYTIGNPFLGLEWMRPHHLLSSIQFGVFLPFMDSDFKTFMGRNEPVNLDRREAFISKTFSSRLLFTLEPNLARNTRLLFSTGISYHRYREASERQRFSGRYTLRAWHLLGNVHVGVANKGILTFEEERVGKQNVFASQARLNSIAFGEASVRFFDPQLPPSQDFHQLEFNLRFHKYRFVPGIDYFVFHDGTFANFGGSTFGFSFHYNF